MGVRQAMALIANVQQATGEEKRGPVETELTGQAAMALYKEGWN